MPKSRKTRRIRRPKGRPRRLGPTIMPQPSPSPVEAGMVQDSPQNSTAMAVPMTPKKPLKRTAGNLAARGLPSWYLPPDSKCRAVALTIMAMRAHGKSEDEIASELKISRKSIAPYVYRAAKNGWITMDTPTDRIRYELMHKVVQKLNEGLDDPTRHQTSGMRVRTQVALKMAEGTVFKEFEQNVAPQQASTVVAVQVVMPPGVPQTMREDTIGGVANYVEGEAVKA